MKKNGEIAIQDAMRNTPKTITDENIHLFPKIIQEFYAQRKAENFAPILTPKYYKTLFSHHQEKLIELNKTNPSLSLNLVVAQRIAALPEFIPAEKIIELTTFTIKTWQELSIKEAVAA